MFGRPVTPDDPLGIRFINWAWTTSLMVLLGYVSYWTSEWFWSVVYPLWPFPPEPVLGEPPLGMPLGELSWVAFLRIVKIIMAGAVKFFWFGWLALFSLLMLFVFNPLEFGWQWILFRRGSGGATAGWRRTKGLVVGVLIGIVFFWLPYFALLIFSGIWVFARFPGSNVPGVFEFGTITVFFYVWAAGVLAVSVFLYFLMPVEKELLGRITAPVRRWWRRRGFGAGGSAGFGGLFEEFTLRYKSGAVLLGSSLYYGTRREAIFKIGIKDDRHLLTIAGTRGGKGRSAIIPNLIVWPHSALVIDPKGTNAAVTAARRGKGGGRVKSYLGQDVFVVDPFEIVKGVKRASFNPLDVIDINRLTVKEDIGLLADAIVVPEEGKSAAHFVEIARMIIAGVIAHLLTRGNGEMTPSLIDVRRALTGTGAEMNELFGEMVENEAAGGLPRVAANVVDTAGGEELGGFMTTITRNMSWLDSGAIKQVLERSDFKLADLKKGKMTVYVVLPPDKLEEHKRFMRVFVNLAIGEMSREPHAKKPVLFVLDEFYALGTMTLLEKAAALLAGYNVKLWPIVQNLTQLEELYPKNWETFFSAAGTFQVFAVNDLKTEEYLVRRLGKTVRDIDVGERVQRVVSQLRETGELEEELARETLRQIVFRAGMSPLLLRRMNYDTSFPKKQYARDPDQPRRWWQWN